MSEEVISSLCEQFVIRLRDNSSSNHRQHRFFRNGTGSEVFHSNQQDLRELLRHLCQFHAISLDLLPLLVQRTLSDLSTVFAILLWVRGRHEVPVLRQFLDLILEAAGRGDGATLKVTDDDLPLSRSTATGTFPLKGAEFYEKQFKFCAVTLVKREEVIYKDDRCKCPLPYLEESRIGEGAFGQVWSVRIEKRHLQSRGKHTETTVALEYARKDFQLNQEQAFQEEREILNRILDQPRRHRNIMVALASLQYGNTYSLFFDLASCNLAEYLHAEDHSPPWSWEEKCAIYRRGVTLAGALAFLHTEFRNQSLEMLSCYHLDLKPHNILVFNAYTSSEEWKITDFGLSRVKGRRHGGDEDVALVMPFLRKAQWGPRHFQEPSTMNRRGEGTYLAPECSLPNGRVSSASDVWSFGCIFSLVMSYIDAGRSGVVAFATKRRQQEHGDSFYTIKRRGREPELSPVVKNWFSHLKKRASASPHVMEGKVVGRTLDFLQKDVLHPKRDRRVMATRLEAELSEISRRFYQPLEISGSRVKKWRFSHSKQPPYIPQHQKLPLDQSLGIQSSLFAPGGDLLVIHSLPKAQVFSPNEIVSSMEEHAAIPKPRLILLPNARLECIANSSTLICACLAVPYFECYFYVASESSLTSLPNNARVYRPHMGSIKKVAISADGEWAAFIITRSPYGPDSDALVYLLRTKDLVGVSSDAISSPPSSRSNSPVQGHSSDSITSGGGTISQGSQIGPVAQIRSFIFSSDAQYLVIISQLDPEHLCIRAWDTHCGSFCADLNIAFSGSSIVGDTLFTACTMCHHTPSLFILCQGRYLLYISSWSWDHRVHTLPGHIFNVFARDDDAALVLLGNNGDDRLLRAYTMPIPISGPPELKEIAMSNLSSYSAARDSAVLAQGTRSRRMLLVATARGEFLAIRIPDGT